jgi:NTP pyrophosphatase (non-canonical NTP hydrolase)
VCLVQVTNQIEIITLDHYARLAMRTARPHDSHRDALLYSSHAIAGEAGEYVDLIKKSIFHGHALDRDCVRSELGDLLWGVQFAAQANGFRLRDIAEGNIAKLAARYPNGFSEWASINRAA